METMLADAQTARDAGGRELAGLHHQMPEHVVGERRREAGDAGHPE